MAFISKTCLLLNRPQRPQRHLLCLGDPYHASDVEPLVGPVSPQSSKVTAALQFPQLDRPVFPTARYDLSVRTYADRVYPSLMGLDRGEAHALLDIPPAQDAIGAPAHQPFTGRFLGGAACEGP